MNNAYITLLSTNNYLYGCIGLMYSWKATNPKYPFYCIVTEDITEKNIFILESIGYKIIREKRYIPQSYFSLLKQCENNEKDVPFGASASDLQKNGWQHAWTKLHIFKYEQFDKILYIDADSYICQNLDYIFDYPSWSGVSEFDAPFLGYYRFLSAFLLVSPSEKVYSEIIQLAEDNPMIFHYEKNKYQLSNDYDLLNLYKSDWGEDQQRILPNFTYVDSFILRTSEGFAPFILNNFQKFKAIHLTGDKPWIAGTSRVDDYGGEWGLWKELYLLYIKFLNQAILDINNKGIAVLLLIK
jgi:hypothetical protein